MHREEEISLCITTLCLALSVQKPTIGKLFFVLGLGKEAEKSWIKCKRVLLNYFQNLVQRAVQNVKDQMRKFVRNDIVWGDISDVK